MAAKPTPGASDGTWGDELNAYLAVGHNTDGTHSLQAIKAWVVFDGSAAVGTITADDSFNITSVTKASTGTYTITWATDFANTNYCVVITSVYNSEENAGPIFQITKSVGSMALITTKTTNAAIVTDFDQINIMAIGDQ